MVICQLVRTVSLDGLISVVNNPMQKDCPNANGWLILILASMCTVAPLAFLDISEGQWIEGARGAMVVNET